MLVRNATKEQIIQALADTNLDFDNNITFNRYPEYVGQTRNDEPKYRLTLTVKDSSKAGGRRGHTGRRIAAACWHVHGTFFDNLLELAPDAEIITNNRYRNPITAASGNWRDRNIGSLYHPFYFSEACDC